MLKCRDVPQHAGQLCDHDLTLRQRLSLYLHLLLCGHCRRYLQQLGLVRRLLPEAEARKSDRTDEEQVQRILQQLDRQP